MAEYIWSQYSCNTYQTDKCNGTLYFHIACRTIANYDAGSLLCSPKKWRPTWAHHSPSFPTPDLHLKGNIVIH